ncbi:MAG TPA: 50S ribosomal protein L9 [Candidatus Krumholzibacteriaceae bacterium]|nr:50S ribosomal protein L9 [Candidatus Krumholzibacteriaceae bacterium]
MEIILRDNIENLGKTGEIVDVKDGYARNFLIPKGLAVIATRSSKKVIEEEDQQRKIRARKIKRNLEGTAEKMKGISCTITVQASDEDRLYGSVGASDIAEAINKHSDIKIESKQIILEEPIKILGVYTVTVRLHKEVEVPVKVWVVKE